jgi:hypothetical protein
MIYFDKIEVVNILSPDHGNLALHIYRLDFTEFLIQILLNNLF